MARRHRTVLIVGRGGMAVGLGWLIASMVYLAMVASIAAFVAQAVAGHWSLSLSDVVTVQVPDAGAESGAAGQTTRLGAVLDILQRVPQIERLSVFDAERTRALLDPWLGAGLAADIPLPVQIDLKLKRSASLDIDTLRRDLAAVASGTEVDDHSRWLRRVGAVTTTVAYGGWLVVFLVGVVAVISVIYSVAAGLAVNRDTIELLHLMGARDSFVAGRFQRYVFAIALPACVIGGGLAAASTLAVAHLFDASGSLAAAISDFDVVDAFSLFTGTAGLGGPFVLGALEIPRWAAIVAVPVGFLLIAVVVARFAALAALRRSA